MPAFASLDVVALVGIFVYCGGGLIWRWIRGIRELRDIGEIGSNKITQTEKMLVVFFAFALVLVIVPEFIYFKDIYPAHFRSNTMFKLGYEAFILFSIVTGYAISSYIFRQHTSRIMNHESGIMKGARVIFFLFLLPQLILVSIYPIFSVRSYFNSLKRYEGIDGLGWLRREYPTDYSAIKWLNSQNIQCPISNIQCDRVAIVEADGDSYTDFARVSAFTGRPTIIGWAVHEWLWRGTYDAVAPRREEVRQIYESEDIVLTASLLNKYSVHYVIVGKLEREKYKSLQEWKFGQLGREIFRAGGTIIYIIEEPIDKERGA